MVVLAFVLAVLAVTVVVVVVVVEVATAAVGGQPRMSRRLSALRCPPGVQQPRPVPQVNGQMTKSCSTPSIAAAATAATASELVEEKDEVCLTDHTTSNS